MDDLFTRLALRETGGGMSLAPRAPTIGFDALEAPLDEAAREIPARRSRRARPDSRALLAPDRVRQPAASTRAPRSAPPLLDNGLAAAARAPAEPNDADTEIGADPRPVRMNEPAASPIAAPLGVRPPAPPAPPPVPPTTEHPSKVAQAARLARDASDRSPERAAAPVVQVTIGRVEIRAAAAPAPPREAARPSRPESMSLTDYLRRGTPR